LAARFLKSSTGYAPKVMPSGEPVDDFKKRAAKNLEGVAPEGIKAIERFTGEDYKAIRAAERGASPEEIAAAGGDPARADELRRTSDLISRAVRDAQPEPGTVFRGIGGMTRAQVVKALSTCVNAGPEGFGLGQGGLGATSSATWSRAVANRFTDGHDEESESGYAVFYVIHGKSQVAIQTIADHDAERELLFAKEARFRLVSVARKAGANQYLIVELEEV